MTVASFRNHLPVKIRFGDGVACDLSAVLAEEGATRPLIVIDEGLEGLVPEVAAAVAALTGAERFEKEPGEPTVTLVEATADRLSDTGCDAVVAIGGGSAMDTAKAARLVAGQGERYLRFARGEVAYIPPAIPLVCVPTTAGTGSEVSGGAVITDDATHTKAGIASPFLRAQHALVDPVLTWGLPPGITAMTGIDALAQAIAAVVVRAATPVGDGIALEATRLAGGALVRAVRDGSDHDARSDMACASLLARPRDEHLRLRRRALARPGHRRHVRASARPHDRARPRRDDGPRPPVRPRALRADRRRAPEPQDGSGDGSRAIRAVTRILNDLEFDTLEAVGVREEHLDELTEKALADYFISIAPEPWSALEVRAAYAQGLALGAHR